MPASKKSNEGKIQKSNLLELTEEECYCDIFDLYKLLAVKSGTDPDSVKYNCTKIRVTESVLKKIFAFYEEQIGYDNSNTSIIWLHVGPKANLNHEGYFAEIEDGFFIEEQT